MLKRKIKIQDLIIGGNNPLVLFAGPCVIENEKTVFQTARFLKDLTSKLKIPFIFKASYDKANRTSVLSYRGPGLSEGLRILAEVKMELGIPLITDVHTPEEAMAAAQVVDIIQIPAFLCRQTDLVTAAARTRKAINVKKGQFLAPWDIKNIIGKIDAVGNQNILVTERGATFGYNNLVVDMRSLVILRDFNYPVVFDATHSVQYPGGSGDSTGGDRRFVPALARAATATGIDALFMEVHPEPDKALCDGPNSLNLEELPNLLREIKYIDALVKKRIKRKEMEKLLKDEN